MTYAIKPLSCDPKKLKGLSEKLIVSHWENNYSGAVKRLNAISGQLAAQDFATASVNAPALGQWHTVRLVAVGDHMQAWLDGKRYLDHHDSRFKSGRVGLWTKADSITAFDDLTIRGVTGGR